MSSCYSIKRIPGEISQCYSASTKLNILSLYALKLNKAPAENEGKTEEMIGEMMRGYEVIARIRVASENKFAVDKRSFRRTNLRNDYGQDSLIKASSIWEFGFWVLSDVFCNTLADPLSRFICKVGTKVFSKHVYELMKSKGENGWV